MYKRDLITSEIQKLAEVLSRIMGLKKDGELDAADTLFKQTCEEKFGITEDVLVDINLKSFKETLVNRNHPPEILNSLTNFLYFYLLNTAEEASKPVIAAKLQYVYQVLEFDHHTVSLENMSRQEVLKKYL